MNCWHGFQCGSLLLLFFLCVYQHRCLRVLWKSLNTLHRNCFLPSSLLFVFHKNSNFFCSAINTFFFIFKIWKVKKVLHLAQWTLPRRLTVCARCARDFRSFFSLRINWIKQIAVNWFFLNESECGKWFILTQHLMTPFSDTCTSICLLRYFFYNFYFVCLAKKNIGSETLSLQSLAFKNENQFDVAKQQPPKFVRIQTNKSICIMRQNYAQRHAKVWRI